MRYESERTELAELPGRIKIANDAASKAFAAFQVESSKVNFNAFMAAQNTVRDLTERLAKLKNKRWATSAHTVLVTN